MSEFYQYSDGGRAAAIATGMPYKEVYDEINRIAKTERKSYGKRSNSRTGIWPKTLKKFLEARGFVWVATMKIGSGCTTHLHPQELPKGTLVLRLSRHYAAFVDGKLLDSHDCSREGTRCVYGYWIKQ